MSVVYFVQHPDDKHIKIGVSSNLPQRLDQLRWQYRASLVLLGVQDGNKTLERELHLRFKKQLRFGEWFVCNDEILEYIRCNTHLPTPKAIIDNLQPKKTAPPPNSVPRLVPRHWRNRSKIASLIETIRLTYGEDIANRALDDSIFHSYPQSVRQYLESDKISTRRYYHL